MIHTLLRKSFPLVIICLLIGTAGASVPSSSMTKTISIIDRTTLYVGGNGEGNYTKIQDAINDAVDGDTIYVYDDSSPYHENLMVEKSITLVGEKRETTIIDSNEELSVIFIMNADGVTISGFTIQNSGVLWINHGIDIHSSYNTISDNIIRHNQIGIGLYTTDDFIANHNNISNNIIEENEDQGIYLFQSQYNIISMNTISNNFGGVILSQASHNIVSDNAFVNDGVGIYGLYQNTIMNNTVNGKSLIYLEGKSDMVLNEDAGQIILVNCNKITVQNQDLSNGCVGITLVNTHNSLISNNTISSNEWYSIFLIHSNSNNISMNTISGSKYGIVFDTSNNNYIIRNKISSNILHGIWFFQSNNNIISTNIIKQNGGRKWIQDGIGLYLYNSSDNNINQNNFIHNAFDAFFYKGSNNKWESNYWNRPRLLPKPIRGRVSPILGWRWNFDWHPAKEPYDI